MSSPKEALSGRERALAAAVRVILRDGILALTLDAVAKEASLSKGGLLYHFASKELLIRALMEQFIGLFEQRIGELRKEDPDPQGRWTRAFIRACSEKIEQPQYAASPHELRRVFFSLLATSLVTPELTNITAELSKRWKAEFAADNVNPIDQLLLVAASDGLLFWEMVGVMQQDDPMRPLLVDELLHRADNLAPADQHPWSLPFDRL
jgi:AcrR family transcriptional regulator